MAKETGAAWQPHLRLMLLEEEDSGGHERIEDDPRRPNLGFPLGTALVLLIICGISAFFWCCYHWEKIRIMHSRQTNTDINGQPSIPSLQIHDASIAQSRKNLDMPESGRSLPVVMPGDDIPKFIAWPAPHGFAGNEPKDAQNLLHR